MSKQTNLAYDLSRYETKKAVPEPKIRERKAIIEGPTVVKTVAMILVTGFLMCCMIYSKAETASLQSRISAQNDNLQLLYSENVRMKSEIDRRTSITNVDDYAQNVLGLEKLDKSQIEYVELGSNNVVEIPEDSRSIFTVIKDKCIDFLEYIKG